MGKKGYEPTETMAKRLLALMAPLFSLSILLALTLTAVWVLRPQMARAANFVVNSTADAVDAVPGDGICNDGSGACTLRAAVMEANALTGANTITLPAGIYILTVSGLNEDKAATGDLDISRDLTITGAGAGTTIIDGGALDRVFHLLPGTTVKISGVTVRNGNSGGNGGGVHNEGTLTLVDSAVSNNTTAGSAGGGGIFNFAGTVILISSTVANNAASNNGGGVLNFGKLTLTNSTISNNRASNDGGGVFNSGGALTSTNSTVSNNTATNRGGGIANNGTTELTNTIIANSASGGDCAGTITSLGHNLDSDGTCGLFSSGDLSRVTPLLGPLQSNGGPTQTHALLSGSPAIDSGDDRVVSASPFLNTDQRGEPRLQGVHVDIGAFEAAPPVAFTVDSTADAVDVNSGDGICGDSNGKCTLRAAIMEANALAKAVHITLPPGTYTLVVAGLGENAAFSGDLDIAGGLTITGAGPANTIIDGGGIDRVFHVLPRSTVHMAGVTVRNGSLTGFEGGGILNEGTLTLVGSAVSDNTTAGSLGGGGIFNLGGTVILIRSTVDNNAASNNGGGVLNFGRLTLTNSTISKNAATHGGGVFNSGTLIITNSTISNNRASNDGGGILNSGALTLTNSTVSNNTATNRGGGIANNGTAELTNTIIANSASGGDCVGIIASRGHNLASDNTCSLTTLTDLPNTDPFLGPLANNGGLTKTHALLTGNPAIGLAGSKAINAGDDGVVGSPLFLSTDQRGKPRLGGQHVDIGAYEAKAAGLILPDTVVPRQGTAGIPLKVLGEASDGLGPLATSQAPTSQAPGVPGDGLGAYQFELRYNPTVLQVLDVLGGAPPFDGVTAKNINNQSGIVKWTHFQATDPVGPVGAINLANVVVQAVGEPGSCSPLGLLVTDLVNTNGEFIPNTDVDGRVCVGAPL